MSPRRAPHAWRRQLGVSAIWLASLCAASASAQRVPSVDGQADIATGVANGARGVLAVNQTAGLNNAQANQVTLTTATATFNDNASAQRSSGAARVPRASAVISGNAFSNTSGAVLVNQSAGAGNLQRNSVQIGTAAPGVETVGDGELSAMVSKNSGVGPSVRVQGVREAAISNDAFKNVSGIVQINQTAGAGNATANSFVLRPPAGTLFN
ncbi:hypothetical protein QS306_05125 [Paraburkholderia bonniea]|uniref:hypothetical protein n=1 Tax=Paraburkholderia bonniea TaxID=2152891 RepID=UPI00129247B2|nr:hypothetical protein [Paraburkholderia bonniea]WJF91036.1 hypothetical protein QS306_05125 [Paraburkholderia bonniea]WJF94350.1 hypothetical protein QS308_05130 [Paraburkholderia bonniea]